MRMVGRAFVAGLVGLIIVPIVLALGALAIGHATGGCGPGSSGGCEMGAASLAIYAAIPAAILCAIGSVVRDLMRKPRR
jgi:hypothetical protein